MNASNRPVETKPPNRRQAGRSSNTPANSSLVATASVAGSVNAVGNNSWLSFTWKPPISLSLYSPATIQSSAMTPAQVQPSVFCQPGNFCESFM